MALRRSPAKRSPNAALVEQVLQSLGGGIMAGEYPPGAKLPEVSLARSLGVSRGPLREALIRLENHGLVQRTPFVGTHVTRLSRDDLIELMCAREALEGMAARLAADFITRPELRRLEELIEGRAREPVPTRPTFAEALEKDFHWHIAQASRSKLLMSYLFEDLYYVIQLYRRRSSAVTGRSARSGEEHRAVLAALEARDGDAAERTMRQHLGNARENMLAAWDREAAAG